MSSSSNTAKTLIPAFVIVLALIGFMVTSYWYYSQEIADVRKEMGHSKEEMSKLLSAQSEKIALREVSLNALSEDVVKKGAKIEELEKALSAAQENIRKSSSALEDKLGTLRTMLDSANRRCTDLEAKIRELGLADETTRATIQKQIGDLKRQIAEVAKQMLVLREETLAARAAATVEPIPPATSGSSTVIPLTVNPIPATSNTPKTDSK